MAQKLTKLLAINQMLRTVGELPVAALSIDLPADQQIAIATQAEDILEEVSYEVMLDSEWNFNWDFDVELTPVNSQIVLADNVLSIDHSDRTNLDIVMREGKLYDRKEQSFTMSAPVWCDIQYLLSFEYRVTAGTPPVTTTYRKDIPEAIKNYILKKSARRFQQQVIGAANLEGYTEADEAQALQTAKRHDANTADYNIFNNPEMNWGLRRH